MSADEEERLNRMLNKRADAQLEQKKREALAKYAQQGGVVQNFVIPEKETSKPSYTVAPVPAVSASSAPVISQQGSNSNWKEEHERKVREEKEREAQEDQKRQEALKALSTEHHDDLSKWKEDQEKSEKEFQRKRHEEDRKKIEDAEKLKRERMEAHLREEELAKQQRAGNQPQAAAPEQTTNTCTGCGQTFASVIDIYIVNNKKYCKPCSTKALTGGAGLGKCAKCQLPLETTSLKAAGRKYHPECLRCRDCNGSVAGGFRQNGKDFICINCVGTGFGKR